MISKHLFNSTIFSAKLFVMKHCTCPCHLLLEWVHEYKTGEGERTERRAGEGKGGEERGEGRRGEEEYIPDDSLQYQPYIQAISKVRSWKTCLYQTAWIRRAQHVWSRGQKSYCSRSGGKKGGSWRWRRDNWTLYFDILSHLNQSAVLRHIITSKTCNTMWDKIHTEVKWNQTKNKW